MGRDGKLVTSFADMGTQAPEILNNGNRKLFFILIDPTSEGREQALQAEAVNRLKSLMFGKVDGRNPNEAIMRRVEGLHFIVTKADTLAGGPSQAREVLSLKFDGIVHIARRQRPVRRICQALPAPVNT